MCLPVRTPWRSPRRGWIGRSHRDKDFLKYRGARINLRLEGKIEGRRHVRGELVDYEDGDDGKILVVKADGKVFRIPRGAVVKANLEYEL